MFHAILAIQILGIFIILYEQARLLTRKPSRSQVVLIFLMVALLINFLGAFIEITAHDMEQALLGIRFSYVGKPSITFCMFLFITYFCHIRLPHVIPILAGVETFCATVIAFTCPYHNLFYTSYDFVYTGIFPHLVMGHGLVYWIHFGVIAIFICFLVCCIIRQYVRAKSKIERSQARSLLAILLEAVLAGREYLVFDGAMGTMIQKAAVPDVYRVAVGCARAAGAQYVAGDIGPLGVLLDPYGDLEFEEAYDLFAEQAVATEQVGADLLLVETIADLSEMETAVRACRKQTYLPIFATITFVENGRMFFGGSPERVAAALCEWGVQAVGVNCSVGPAQMLPAIQQMASVSAVPLMTQPNAGLLRLEHNATVYDVTPAEFQLAMEDIIEAGATIVGSCCGANPSFASGVVQQIKRSSLL